MTWMLSLLLAVGLSCRGLRFLNSPSSKGVARRVLSAFFRPTPQPSPEGRVVRSVPPVIVILVVAARACARAVRLVLVLLLVLVPARRAARGRLRFSRFCETQAAPVLSARRASAVDRHAARAVVARAALVVLLDVLLGLVAALVVLLDVLLGLVATLVVSLLVIGSLVRTLA